MLPHLMNALATANPVQDAKQPKATRRGFLLGSAALGGGLAVGFSSAGPALAQSAASARTLSPYLRITPDNLVTVLVAHLDMGQGIYHACATLVAEELGADWSQMRAEGAAGNPKAYGNIAWGGMIQGTGGSTGVTSSFDRYRKAGAAAREMLVAAAASEWAVPASEVKVERGVLSHANGKKASFGELAAKAAMQTAPANPKLKAPADWAMIGNETLPRLDTVTKSTGKQTFTIDVKLPGMLTAVMIHPPLFGATLKSFDAAKAKAVKGVVDVVAVPRGVAVVASDMWSAIKGREAMDGAVVWDDAKAEKRSSADLAAEYRKTAAGPGKANARREGDVAKGFAASTKVMEQTFEFPYLAHAALEPLNAVARKNADGTLEVWGGHQMPDLYQALAASIADVAPARVTMHVMKTGGGFGRRAVMDGDVITEAVSIAKAIGWKAPVKVQWLRDNDMRGGRYRPAYVHRVKAGLDASGKIIAWENHIVGQSILGGTPFESMMVTNGVDLTSVEGGSNIPYDIPNIKVDLTTTTTGVPVLWWRAVGSTHTSFVVETFIDELAEAAGKDPVAYRLGMLAKHPKHAAVLKLAAEKAGWTQPLPVGRFRGVAVAESFSSFVAQVAEVSVDAAGKIKVERVVCALDCGVAVNPDNIRAQIEGGIGFGLGAVMNSQLTLTKGAVDQGSFAEYPTLTIAEMPKVEVHIIKSAAGPTGVGEPGVPPIGPAVANAIYAANKKRMRILPFARSENA
ncbi:MAG: molybdopterin cofactor-binding domain-containing protein [Bosea sp. (in: a-proteobacteria)]